MPEFREIMIDIENKFLQWPMELKIHLDDSIHQRLFCFIQKKVGSPEHIFSLPFR